MNKMYEVLNNKIQNSNGHYPFEIGDIVEIESKGAGSRAREMFPDDYEMKVNGRPVSNDEFTPSEFDRNQSNFRKIVCRLVVGDSVIPFPSYDGVRVTPSHEQWWYQYQHNDKDYVATKQEKWICKKQTPNGWEIENSQGHIVHVPSWRLEKR